MKYFIRIHNKEKNQWKETKFWSRTKMIETANKLVKIEKIDYVEYGSLLDDDWIGFFVEAVLKNNWSI